MWATPPWAMDRSLANASSGRRDSDVPMPSSRDVDQGEPHDHDPVIREAADPFYSRFVPFLFPNETELADPGMNAPGGPGGRDSARGRRRLSRAGAKEMGKEARGSRTAGGSSRRRRPANRRFAFPTACAEEARTWCPRGFFSVDEKCPRRRWRKGARRPAPAREMAGGPRTLPSPARLRLPIR